MQQPVEQVAGASSEKALGRRRAIHALEEVVVHGGQGLELAGTESVQPVVVQS